MSQQKRETRKKCAKHEVMIKHGYMIEVIRRIFNYEINTCVYVNNFIKISMFSENYIFIFCSLHLTRE